MTDKTKNFDSVKWLTENFAPAGLPASEGDPGFYDTKGYYGGPQSKKKVDVKPADQKAPDSFAGRMVKSFVDGGYLVPEQDPYTGRITYRPTSQGVLDAVVGWGLGGMLSVPLKGASSLAGMVKRAVTGGATPTNRQLAATMKKGFADLFKPSSGLPQTVYAKGGGKAAKGVAAKKFIGEIAPSQKELGEPIDQWLKEERGDLDFRRHQSSIDAKDRGADLGDVIWAAERPIHPGGTWMKADVPYATAMERPYQAHATPAPFLETPGYRSRYASSAKPRDLYHGTRTAFHKLRSNNPNQPVYTTLNYDTSREYALKHGAGVPRPDSGEIGQHLQLMLPPADGGSTALDTLAKRSLGLRPGSLLSPRSSPSLHHGIPMSRWAPEALKMADEGYGVGLREYSLPEGNLRRFREKGDLEDTGQWGGELFVAKPGERPMVKTSVGARPNLVDLNTRDAVYPPDLMHELEKQGIWIPAHSPLSVRRNVNQYPGGPLYPQPRKGEEYWHDRSPVLLKWLRKQGLDGAIVPDVNYGDTIPQSVLLLPEYARDLTWKNKYLFDRGAKGIVGGAAIRRGVGSSPFQKEEQ